MELTAINTLKTVISVKSPVFRFTGSCCFALGFLLSSLSGNVPVWAQSTEPMNVGFTATVADAPMPTPLSSSDILRAAGRHLASINSATMPAVVNIESRRETRSGEVPEAGSGVMVRNPHTQGVYVVTNRHVVADAGLNQIDIFLFDGRVIRPTEKLEDAASDLSVLRVNEPDLQVAQFGDSENLDIGHFVLAMGSPFGLSQSVTLGIISAKGRRSLELPGRKVVNQDFLQTDAAINPGNSGGPLIDLDGRVVGINTAIVSQGGGNEGIGFSIPSNLVQFVINQLIQEGRVRRGYLGVTTDENFTIDVARKLKLDRKRGARIIKVVDASPSQRAGLRTDDVILSFDGYDIVDHDDLINKVNVTPFNKMVRLIILRDGQQQSVNVELMERPEERRSEIPLPLLIDSFVPYKVSSLQLQSMNSTLARQCGYHPEQNGLLVKSSEGLLENTELQLYDVIEEVARQPVSSLQDFEEVVRQQPHSADIIFKVRRVTHGEVETRLVIWQRQQSTAFENEID